MQYHFPYEGQIEKKVGAMTLHTQEINETYSTAWIEIDGEHGEITNMGAERVYLILEGMGTFVINGEIIEVKEKDVVYIPKGTTYNLVGSFAYVLVNSPAFDEEQDVWTDDEGRGMKG